MGAAKLGVWHDEVRHTEGLFEAAVLITASFMIDLFNVLLIFLFKFAFPTRAQGPPRLVPGTTR